MENIANTRWKHKKINMTYRIVEVIEGAMSLYNQNVVVFVDEETERKIACSFSDFKELARPMEDAQ